MPGRCNILDHQTAYTVQHIMPPEMTKGYSFAVILCVDKEIHRGLNIWSDFTYIEGS